MTRQQVATVGFAISLMAWAALVLILLAAWVVAGNPKSLETIIVYLILTGGSGTAGVWLGRQMESKEEMK